MLVEARIRGYQGSVFSRRSLAISALFSLIVTLVFHIASQWSPVLLRLEHQLGDWRTGLLSDRLPAQHPRLALVLIDEATLRKEQYTSPVDRRVLARLVRKLDELGAKTIALDFLFYRQTEPAKDEELAAALRKARAHIALAAGDERTLLDHEEQSFQREFLKKVDRSAGYANIDQDRDEVVRHRLAPAEGGLFPKSFATVIAETDGVADPSPSGRIAWLRRAENGANAFFDVKAGDILDEGAVATALRDRFKNRIVIIGGAFPDRDRHRTPLFGKDGELGSGKVHGVYLHAHAVAQLLDQRWIRDVPDWPVVFVLCFLGYGLGSSLIRHGLGWMVGGISTALLIIIDLLVFWKLRLVVPYMPASMAWIVGGFGGYIIGRMASTHPQRRN